VIESPPGAGEAGSADAAETDGAANTAEPPVGAVTSAAAPKRSRMLRSVRMAPSSAAGIEGSDGTCS
jgi:hypothetical protein